ncbi:MAG: hypothetical protein WDW38_001040 [Sanguina aurantia]
MEGLGCHHRHPRPWVSLRARNSPSKLPNMVPLTPGLQPDTARCPRLGWLAIAALQDLTRLCSPLTHLHVHGCLYKLNTRTPVGAWRPRALGLGLASPSSSRVTGTLAGRSLTC